MIWASEVDAEVSEVAVGRRSPVPGAFWDGRGWVRAGRWYIDEAIQGCG